MTHPSENAAGEIRRLATVDETIALASEMITRREVLFLAALPELAVVLGADLSNHTVWLAEVLKWRKVANQTWKEVVAGAPVNESLVLMVLKGYVDPGLVQKVKGRVGECAYGRLTVETLLAELETLAKGLYASRTIHAVRRLHLFQGSLIKDGPKYFSDLEAIREEIRNCARLPGNPAQFLVADSWGAPVFAMLPPEEESSQKIENVRAQLEPDGTRGGTSGLQLEFVKSVATAACADTLDTRESAKHQEREIREATKQQARETDANIFELRSSLSRCLLCGTRRNDPGTPNARFVCPLYSAFCLMKISGDYTLLAGPAYGNGSCLFL